MAETVKKEVVQRLQLVNTSQLTEICDRLHLEIATNKKENQMALFNLVMRHITSEEMEDGPDGGLAVLQQMNEELAVMLELDKKPIAEAEGGKMVSSATIAGTGASGSGETKTKIELHKLRKFKISGIVCGGENALDYTSLRYQMRKGRTLGYSSKEIMSGVIKAMKAGSSVRRYFEGRAEWTEQNFLEILRSHCNVKDSATLLDEMVNSRQEPTETEMNYVMRVMDLRNNIMSITKDEDCPLGEPLVRKRFVYTLSVGFKKDTIRLEMMNALKKQALTDEELVREVKDVVNRDDEHKKRAKPSKCAAVNVVDERDSKRDHFGDRERKDPVLAEISKLAAKVDELAKMRGEMDELKRKIDNNKEERSGDGQNQYRGGRRFIKCQACEQSNAFCTHCSKCGEGDHKRNQCPKNE